MSKRDSSKTEKDKKQFFDSADIEALPLKASHYEVGDGMPKKTGLRVRIYPSGKKTFIWRLRHEGKMLIHIIGDHPGLTVDRPRAALVKA